MFNFGLQWPYQIIHSIMYVISIQITLEFHLQMKNECPTGLCNSYVQSSYYKVQIAMLLIQFVFDMPKLYVGSCAMHAYKLLSKKKMQ